MGSFFSKTSNILLVVGITLFVLGIFGLPGANVGSRTVVKTNTTRERLAVLIIFLGMLLALVGLILKWGFGL